MLASRRFRLSALLAAIAVIAASVLPAFPAVADDAPTPDPTPVVEPVETPTPDPTPLVDPPVVEPVETPTPDPTPVVEPVETPTPEPTTAPAGTVKYSGTVQEFANDGIDVADGIVLFSINGQGYLRADVSGLTPRPDALNPVSLTLTVPAGLTLSGDADARFTQLAAASTDSALVAVSSAKIKQTAPRETAALVNQTPNTSAIHHIFAVYVSPSNKKVKDAGQANSTAAQALVDYADTYWNAQSSGSIHFTLDHVVPWYQSTYSCKTNAGSTSLWNQAIAKAKTAGFVPGKNNHLVLIMPNGGPAYSYCGGAIGLAGVGGSVNQGGVVWVMGNTDPIAKETIAHELGHNMSLGHADWLACTSSNPSVGVANTNYSPPGIAGCTVNNYGDTTDVMGFGIGDGLSGALSSPQAIRAGIWPSSKWTTAPIGSNQTFTLLPVADHSGAAGAHAVVVQDTDGTAYFVELRNFQNEDATNYIGCNSQACTLNLPNVRILRFEPSGYSGYPGADTYLIGRSNTNVGYTAASIPFTMPSGDSIQVTAVSSTSATIKVTRVTPGTATTEFDDWVNLTRTIGYDGSLRVGDTMSLFLGDYWNQETYTFAWYRNGVTIAGATGQNYTLTALDLGTKINASVTPLGQAAVYDYADNTPVPAGGYGPIAAGVYQASDPGTITINNAATPLQAVTAAWPAGTTFAFQWYRGKTLTTATTAATGSGAATASYTPNTADYDQYLRVRVTASVPGYNPVARYSVAANYSISSPSTLTIAGTPKVGTQVTADTSGLAFFSYGGIDVTPGVSLTYQWLRNGIPITDTFATTIDATDDNDYTLRSLDYGAKLTLRVTASKPGLVAKVITSATFTTTIKGTIQASSPASSIANVFDAAAPAKVTLTATTSGVTEPELSAAGYQWYRVNLTSGVPTAIAGATAAIYKPTAADFPYKLRVVVTIKKANYDSLPLTSVDRDFSVRIDPSTPLGFFGGSVFTFNQTLTANVPNWNVEVTPGSYATISFGTPSFDTFYQWRRAGVSLGLPGNAWSYTPVAADVGKSLSYTVKADYPGYISYSAVSPNSPLIAGGTFAHNQDVSITSVGNTKTAHAATTDVIPNVTLADISYQWTRDGVAIAGATTANYTLSQAADYGKTIKVNVSYKTAGRTTYSQLGVDGTGQYWIKANPVLPVITGIQGIGGALQVAPRTYVDMNTGSTINSGIQSTYQWYRSGVAIAGPLGTNDTYDLIALDKGKTITVKMTVTATGLDYDLPSIATSAATPAIGVSALPGTASADPVLIVQAESTPFVTVVAPTPTGITSPNATPNTVTYQWYRDGAAIAGATKLKYTLTQTDRGHLIKLRITTSHAAILTTTYTTDIRYSNAVDYTLLAASGADVHIYTDLSTGADLAPVTPTYTDANSNVLTGVSQTYQWYRKVGTKTTAITGATNLFYNPQAADVGASLSVRVTTGLLNYIPQIATYTTTPATLKVIKGTLLNTAPLPVVTVSVPATNTLLATPPVVTGAILFPGSLTQHASFTYKWLRNGVAITGATASTYKLVAADTGKNINVLVTANLAGYNSVTLSPSTPLNYSITLDGNPLHIPYMSTNTFTIGSQVAVYNYADLATKDGALVSPPVAFQWLRAGVAIPGATGDTYFLGLADYTKAVTVRLTISTPGYLPLVFVTPSQVTGIGKTLGFADGYPDAYVTVVAGPGLGTLTTQMNDLSPATPVPTYKYQWYRDGSPIAAPLGTASVYKLVALDVGKLISVKVTMTRLNFMVPVTTFGPATGIDYSITADAPVEIDNVTPVTGQTVNAVVAGFHDTETNSVQTPTVSYQWLRNNVAITGATLDHYEVTSADYNTKLSLRITWAQSGHVGGTSTSAQTTTVPKGAITGSFAQPIVTLTPATNTLTATLVAGTYSQTGVIITYKWLRDGTTPISGATASSYKLAAADDGHLISVAVSASKLNLNAPATQPITSTGVDYSIHPSNTAPNINSFPSSPRVGDLLSYSYITYQDGAATPINPVVTQQWLRAGVAITGATGPTYTPSALDLNKLVSVRITATMPGFVTHVVTTAAVTVGAGDLGSPSVTSSMTNTTTHQMTAAVTGLATTGATIAYQWYRTPNFGGGTPTSKIVGAIGSTYTLNNVSDYHYRISVGITVTKSGYASQSPVPAGGVDYSLVAWNLTSLDNGNPLVGDTLTVTESSQFRVESTITVPGGITYQWYRQTGTATPVAIAGATDDQYTVVAADAGKRLIARVTATHVGNLPSVVDASANQAVPSQLSGSFAVPGVNKSSGLLLTGTIASGFSTTAGATVVSEWIKNGTTVVGNATQYQLVAGDTTATFFFRVTVTKAGYQTRIVITAPVVWSVHPQGSPSIDNVTPHVNDTLTLVNPVFDVDGTVFVPLATDQVIDWVVGGVYAGHATTYVVQPADVGKPIYVQVTTAKTGWLDSPNIASGNTANVAP